MTTAGGSRQSKNNDSNGSRNVSTNNLRIWKQVEKTDPAYTKGFSKGGGFKGTATNATYLAMKATETFGPMGTGWGVRVLSEQYVEGHWLDERTRETVHKVLVELWYVDGDKRGEVQQYGQTTFIGRNKNGCFTDEEHAKKSLTDGMSKCLSLLGFAADIHLGRYDDNKYVAELNREFAEKHEAEAKAAAPRITADQATELGERIGETGTDLPKFLAYFKVSSLADMAATDFERARKMLAKKQQQEAA